MLQSNSGEVLPPEIIDMIICNLYSDTNALSTCALVCKNWLPASYHHLFDAIVIRPSNFGRFLEILCSTYCTAAPFIRKVTLEDICLRNSLTTSTPIADSGSDVDELHSDLTTGPTWTLDDVVPQLRLLSSASTLCLDGGNWSEVASKSQALGDFQACFSTITELRITKAEFKTFGHAIEIISVFSLLESLHLDNVGWGYDPNDGVASSGGIEPPPPSQLRYLGLGNCYKRDLLNWLLRHQPTPAVNTVDLGTIFGLNTPSIGNYLCALAGCLEHLQLGFYGLDAGGDAEEFHREVDLSRNFMLRTIRIDRFISYDGYQFTSSVTWVPLILSQIKSPYLEEVAFSIWLMTVEQLEPQDFPIDWNFLDNLFAGNSQFQHLKRLRFWIFGDVEKRDVEREIGRKLPKCAELNILSFR